MCLGNQGRGRNGLLRTLVRGVWWRPLLEPDGRRVALLRAVHSSIRHYVQQWQRGSLHAPHNYYTARSDGSYQH